MDVVVEVGGWEHECCGPAIERDQVVDFHCRRVTGRDNQPRLIETHHHVPGDAPIDERIQGRVIEVEVVQHDGSTQPILRVPSGSALCGSNPDEADDGHLEDPWTGEVLTSQEHDFLITVRVPGERPPHPLSVYRS